MLEHFAVTGRQSESFHRTPLTPGKKLPESAPALVVAAHPDDEVIGLGYCLFSLRPVKIVHLTDGAPYDMRDALAWGFSSREEYARARHAELEQVCSLLRLAPDTLSGMWFPDQTLSWHLKDAAELLVNCFREIDPAVVITHAYEGGHPDHDAAAFAVRAALRLMNSASVHLEFASYNRIGGVHRWLTYLPQPAGECCAIPISEEGRIRKQMLLNCFQTQQRTLQGIPLDWEYLRVAPAYRFTQPPHPGKLNYEYYPWGLTGVQFCRLASDALRTLNLSDGD
jgi:LmbE family N-acetylglucosaminyl deacetylase